MILVEGPPRGGGVVASGHDLELLSFITTGA